MARQKRFRFRILRGTYAESDAKGNLVVYGPRYVDKEGKEQQSEEAGDMIETDQDLVTLRNNPKGSPKYLLIEDRGEQQEEISQEPVFASMNTKQLKAFAKEHEIDLGDATTVDEMRNILQLASDVA